MYIYIYGSIPRTPPLALNPILETGIEHLKLA